MKLTTLQLFRALLALTYGNSARRLERADGYRES
jgi:hypothetical protein